MIYGASRNGISVTLAKHVLIEGCHIWYTSRTNPISGIDLEPDRETTGIEDITVSNCYIHSNASSNIAIQGNDCPVKNIRILNCLMEATNNNLLIRTSTATTEVTCANNIYANCTASAVCFMDITGCNFNDYGSTYLASGLYQLSGKPSHIICETKTDGYTELTMVNRLAFHGCSFYASSTHRYVYYSDVDISASIVYIEGNNIKPTDDANCCVFGCAKPKNMTIRGNFPCSWSGRADVPVTAAAGDCRAC